MPMAVPVTGPDLDPEDIQQPRVVLGAGALLYAVMTAVAAVSALSCIAPPPPKDPPIFIVQ